MFSRYTRPSIIDPFGTVKRVRNAHGVKNIHWLCDSIMCSIWQPWLWNDLTSLGILLPNKDLCMKQVHFTLSKNPYYSIQTKKWEGFQSEVILKIVIFFKFVGTCKNSVGEKFELHSDEVFVFFATMVKLHHLTLCVKFALKSKSSVMWFCI